MVSFHEVGSMPDEGVHRRFYFFRVSIDFLAVTRMLAKKRTHPGCSCLSLSCRSHADLPYLKVKAFLAAVLTCQQRPSRHRGFHTGTNLPPVSTHPFPRLGRGRDHRRYPAAVEAIRRAGGRGRDGKRHSLQVVGYTQELKADLEIVVWRRMRLEVVWHHMLPGHMALRATVPCRMSFEIPGSSEEEVVRRAWDHHSRRGAVGHSLLVLPAGFRILPSGARHILHALVLAEVCHTHRNHPCLGLENHHVHDSRLVACRLSLSHSCARWRAFWLDIRPAPQASDPHIVRVSRAWLTWTSGVARSLSGSSM